MLTRRQERRAGRIPLLFAAAVSLTTAGLTTYFLIVRAPAPIAVQPTPPATVEVPEIKSKPLEPTPAGDLRNLTSNVEPWSAEELARQIDLHFARYWQSQGMQPARRSSDAVFLRRLSLDLTGKIPSSSLARQFLADTDPNKRKKLIREMLEQARFANHLAVTLREVFLPGAQNNPQKLVFLPPFEAWLRLRLADNVPYDQLIAELLQTIETRAAPLGSAGAMLLGPDAYYQANENKPELLAGGIARAVLGLQVQCAECHNHPFADWKQDQFWSFASLFASPTKDPSTSALVMMPGSENLEIDIPNRNRKVSPAFLDGTKPTLNNGSTKARRQALAGWITHGNPYFAKALANRVWWHFLGRGLVHPVDDMGAGHEPSHPEVLEMLANQFVANQYNLKFLASAIVSSEVYQLANEATTSDQQEPVHFASVPIRAMTPEQLYDSIQSAINGRRPNDGNSAQQMVNNLGETRRLDFLQKFAEPGERTSPQGSMLQALALLNGAMIDEGCNPAKGHVLRALLASPFLNDQERFETLFLGTLSRLPTAGETRLLFGPIEKCPAAEKPLAFGTVLWVLLNSSEFATVP